MKNKFTTGVPLCRDPRLDRAFCSGGRLSRGLGSGEKTRATATTGNAALWKEHLAGAAAGSAAKREIERIGGYP